MNPAERINIRDLRAAIQKVKHFGIPTGRLTEYYNYQHEALKAALVPAPPRPLTFAPIQDLVNGHRKTKASCSARVGKVQPYNSKPVQNIVPSAVASPKLQVHHRTEMTAPSVVRQNPSTLPLSVSPSSSSVDSDGPVTPEMHAVPDGELPEINITDIMQEHTRCFAQSKTAFPSSLALETNCGKPSTLEKPWQSILDIMDAW